MCSKELGAQVLTATKKEKTACPVEPGTLWVFNRGVICEIRAKRRIEKWNSGNVPPMTANDGWICTTDCYLRTN